MLLNPRQHVFRVRSIPLPTPWDPEADTGKVRTDRKREREREDSAFKLRIYPHLNAANTHIPITVIQWKGSHTREREGDVHVASQLTGLIDVCFIHQGSGVQPLHTCTTISRSPIVSGLQGMPTPPPAPILSQSSWDPTSQPGHPLPATLCLAVPR